MKPERNICPPHLQSTNGDENLYVRGLMRRQPGWYRGFQSVVSDWPDSLICITVARFSIAIMSYRLKYRQGRGGGAQRCLSTARCKLVVVLPVVVCDMYDGKVVCVLPWVRLVRVGTTEGRVHTFCAGSRPFLSPSSR